MKTINFNRGSNKTFNNLCKTTLREQNMTRNVPFWQLSNGSSPVFYRKMDQNIPIVHRMIRPSTINSESLINIPESANSFYQTKSLKSMKMGVKEVNKIKLSKNQQTVMNVLGFGKKIN